MEKCCTAAGDVTQRGRTRPLDRRALDQPLAVVIGGDDGTCIGRARPVDAGVVGGGMAGRLTEARAKRCKLVLDLDRLRHDGWSVCKRPEDLVIG